LVRLLEEAEAIEDDATLVELKDDDGDETIELEYD